MLLLTEKQQQARLLGCLSRPTRPLFQFTCCSRLARTLLASVWSTSSRTSAFFACILTSSNLRRTTAEELRLRDALTDDQLQDLRHAAEAHRQTRRYVQSWIKPGMAMTEIAERLEECSRRLIGEDGLKRGVL